MPKPEPNEIGDFLRDLGDKAKLYNKDKTKDWTLYEYVVPKSDNRKVGILTLDIPFGPIDTKTLNELEELIESTEKSDLEGIILVNKNKGKFDEGKHKNATLSAGASLTELYLFIKYGHETGDWSKVYQHMEHGQRVFTKLFESSKQIYTLLWNANTHGGGTELILATNGIFGTEKSKITAPEYAHGFFPGWLLMFNLRRIMKEICEEGLEVQEQVRKFVIDNAEQGYSLQKAKEIGLDVADKIYDSSSSARKALNETASTLLKQKESYIPQKGVSLTTDENNIYKKFEDQKIPTPEEAIMLNLYTPGTFTAFEHAKRDNALFTAICREDAKNILKKLEGYGSEDAVKQYINRVGLKEAEFIFNMKEYGHLKPKA